MASALGVTSIEEKRKGLQLWSKVLSSLDSINCMIDFELFWERFGEVVCANELQSDWYHMGRVDLP